MEAWEATAAANAPVNYDISDARRALNELRRVEHLERSPPPKSGLKRKLQRQGTGEKPEKPVASAATGPPAATQLKFGVQPLGACIPERKAFRKPHRRHSGLRGGLSGINVLETPKQLSGEVVDVEEGGGDVDLQETDERSGKCRRSGAFQAGKHHEKVEALLDRLASTFADDYFSAPNHMKLMPQGVLKAMSEPLDKEKAAEHKAEDTPKLFGDWLKLLQTGFSVWVQGLGSKRRLLEAFADEILLPWGAAVVRMAGFNVRFHTLQCLREILDQMHPGAQRLGSSADALVESIALARKAVTDVKNLRPLVLLVHNLELLPVLHQAALASLVARSPRVYLIASTDSIWAPVTWTPRVLDDFCFVPSCVNTHEAYGAEASVRFVGGLPGWADPSADKRKTNKDSLALVLRSLTNNHRELVQVIAEQQVKREGRTGISKSALLDLTTERMIAKHLTQLKSLLNMLLDHQVVVERKGADGSTLYMVACDDRTLVKLAAGKAVEGSDDEDA